MFPRIWIYLGLLAAVSKAKTRGVSPENEFLYESGEFQCGNGSRIPGEWVNDNFCDCPDDGLDEPGTSACPQGSFYCWNVDHQPHKIPSSMVDDGYCDCCDGSDEDPSISVACPNNCEIEATEAEEGKEKTKHSIKTAKRLMPAIATKAKEFHDKLNAQALLIQKQGKKMEMEMKKTINPMAQFQLRKQITELQGKFTMSVKLIEAELGEYLIAVAGCISTEPLSEKAFGGGTKNYVHKNYVFYLCPFRHVLQLDSDLEAWEAANCIARLGSAEAEKCREEAATEALKRKGGPEGNKTPDPTLLGVWQSQYWGEGEGKSLSYMIYRDPGEPCSNGDRRNVNVSFACAEDEGISAVAENGMCNYEMTWESPLHCIPLLHTVEEDEDANDFEDEFGDLFHDDL